MPIPSGGKLPTICIPVKIHSISGTTAIFEQRSDNGTKIFWSRGNGWVIAGLARLLEDMPKDYENRARFEQQYLEMAHKLLGLQDEDGLWRVSLIDPAYLDMGESSGSSFFTFALAWGINNGLLDDISQTGC